MLFIDRRPAYGQSSHLYAPVARTIAGTTRFSQGRLNWWPTSAQAAARLCARELQILLWNGNPEDAGMADDWREVA